MEACANPLPATGGDEIVVDCRISTPMKVVVAYEDLLAGRRAVGLINKYLGDGVDLEPVLWRFDLLDHAHWYKMAVKDSVDADLLILSTSGSSDLPGAVNNWLKESVNAKRGGSTAMIVLCGAEDAWAISIENDSLSDIGALLQRSAATAGTPRGDGDPPVRRG